LVAVLVTVIKLNMDIFKQSCYYLNGTLVLNKLKLSLG